MKKLHGNQSGFSLVELGIVLVALVFIGAGGYFVWSKAHQNSWLNSNQRQEVANGTWKIYTTTNYHIKFIYPASWAINNTLSEESGEDVPQLSAKDGFSMVIRVASTVVGRNPFNAPIIYSKPINVLGQEDHMDFYSNDPAHPNSTDKIQGFEISTKASTIRQFIKSKYIFQVDGDLGGSISDNETIKQAQSNIDYKDAENVAESISLK